MTEAVKELLTPMNHREIEYKANKLPECIPAGLSVLCDSTEKRYLVQQCQKELVRWLEETGSHVFDDALRIDYGTDCLRLYLMFEQTPKEQDAPWYESWQEGALEGLYKFLGRYRRLILAAHLWNQQGLYSGGGLTDSSVNNMEQTLQETAAKINQYLTRGNTVKNRHHIVTVLMEGLRALQKGLKIGEIVTAFHRYAVETAVPYESAAMTKKGQSSTQGSPENLRVREICRTYILLIAPYAPDLSKVLWQALLTGNET